MCTLWSCIQNPNYSKEQPEEMRKEQDQAINSAWTTAMETSSTSPGWLSSSKEILQAVALQCRGDQPAPTNWATEPAFDEEAEAGMASWSPTTSNRHHDAWLPLLKKADSRLQGKVVISSTICPETPQDAGALEAGASADQPHSDAAEVAGEDHPGRSQAPWRSTLDVR